MKRALSEEEEDEDANKKPKSELSTSSSESFDAVVLDENLLYEILRHVDDGRTLARSACVCRQWLRTAHDERLWELICVRDGHRLRSPLQLRAVVSAFGGFRRLYAGHLWPLLRPPPAVASSSGGGSSSGAWPGLSAVAATPQRGLAAPLKARRGNDEFNFSLSMLSIEHFKKMSSINRNK